MLKTTLSFVIVFLLFSMPYLTLAQQTSDTAQAIVDAKKDASKDINTMNWYLFGCLGIGFCSPVVVGASFIYTPRVPTDRLVGKSPEYITSYTQTYQKERKSVQVKATIGGCLSSNTVAAILTGYVMNNLLE